MTMVQDLAAFVAGAAYGDLSEGAREAVRVRLLDSLGCAFGAVGADVPRMVREQVEDSGGLPHCALIGGGRSAPDLAALSNGALVRYLDFNDSYLAPKETCHPSDTIAPVLAAAEYASASGRDLMAAIAAAYQVQCCLSDLAPVRARGFDHTTQGAYGVAAGVSRALGLDADRTANAVAIAGTTLNALRVTRTGALSHWKGLAFPFTSFGATAAAFLAMRGITGPPEVFEGNKGFMDAIAGPFEIDWSKESLEAITQTVLKRYNAEVHSQSALEGILALRDEHGFGGDEVEAIELKTFDVAFNIIGGGEEGEKTTVRTKEEADHSLPYLLAVAVLDGGVMPEQYGPQRISRGDVQSLLRKVSVREDPELSKRFPAEMPARLSVRLRDGRELHTEKSGYEGFTTRPMSWETALAKFGQLSRGVDHGLSKEIVDAVASLDDIDAADLATLLERVRKGE
ncbi:MAG: MmgE/PrpD family protein [Actinomycetota bacterium]